MDLGPGFQDHARENVAHGISNTTSQQGCLNKYKRGLTLMQLASSPGKQAYSSQ